MNQEPNLGVDKPNGLAVPSPLASIANEVVGFALPSEALIFLREISDREIALKGMLQNCGDMRIVFLNIMWQGCGFKGPWAISPDGLRLIPQLEAPSG